MSPAPTAVPADDPDLTVRRLPEYQVTERAVLHQILDEAVVAHVGVVRDARPVVLPFVCARDGDSLLLHGSTGAGTLRRAAREPVCVTVTHLDAMVVARSVFESSVHYRSAVILGDAEVLDGPAKERALARISEHLLPGRTLEVRDSTRKELAATLVLRVPLDRASVKVGRSPASEVDDGESREVWAGIVPLAVRAGDPQPAADVSPGVEVPASVQALRGRLAP
ncbi:MAG: pyridoxamine 5'-phosphate oxidase family protein [Nocardioides sp.]